jgi:hypothetical protein
MSGNTKKRPEPIAAPTFEEIARQRLTQRVTEYREFVARRAAGESLTLEETERVLEVLESLALPDFAFERDADAVKRYAANERKWQAIVADEPQARERGQAVKAEIESTQKRLAELKAEAHRLEVVMSGKAVGYVTSLRQLKHDHATVLDDLEVAVSLRSEEIARRRRSPVGGVA